MSCKDLDEEKISDFKEMVGVLGPAMPAEFLFLIDRAESVIEFKNAVDCGAAPLSVYDQEPSRRTPPRPSTRVLNVRRCLGAAALGRCCSLARGLPAPPWSSFWALPCVHRYVGEKVTKVGGECFPLHIMADAEEAPGSEKYVGLVKRFLLYVIQSACP